MPFAHVRTARLQLDAVTLDDVAEHHALLSDPAVWAHLPSGVHTERAQTVATLERGVEQWQRAGLGYWTARLRPDLPAHQVPPGLEAGAFVGTGGCTVRAGTTWWNLYYRLTRAAWGHGLAAELVAAALDAARTTDPDLPVIAYLLEHNVESKERAERSGLSQVWRGPDAGNPDSHAVRLVHAGRPGHGQLVAAVSALA